MKKKNLLLILSIVIFTACNDSKSIQSTNNTENTSNYEDKDKSSSTIAGYAQKGPFKKASIIKAYRLENGEKTKDVVQTEILDDKGQYSISVPWSGATLLEVSGSYLDEVSGDYIIDQNLSSVTQAIKNKQIKSNVNILTHIASKNIVEKLKTNSQEKVDTLIQDAHSLVAKVFNIDLEENTSLEDLDLTDSEDTKTKKANAQLLKISASILSTSNPTDVIEKISEDLRADGTIDDEALSALKELKTKEKEIDLDKVSNNLKKKLNISKVPSSSSLDGTLNMDNNISFTSKDDVELNRMIQSDEITIFGVNAWAKISVSNGEFKVDDNNFTSTPSTITNNQRLIVRHKSASNYNTKKATKIIIAGVLFTFDSTTKSNSSSEVEIVVSEPSYSTISPTKDDVTVTFTSSSDIITPNGWQKSGNKFTKTYSSNVSAEKVVFADNAGNSTTKTVTISNIDKLAPNVSDASYSEESSTRNPITVTFISRDSDIQTPRGWSKNGNKFTKIYSSNITETIIFTDAVGNETRKSVIISNIDTINPNLISFDGQDYIQVKSTKTQKVWLDRNLGASEVCNGSNDSLCIGDYYQWGRKTNGHEKKDSAISEKSLSSDVLSAGKFIIVSSPFHWKNSISDFANKSLWLGVNADNNVCPDGFKVPSRYELEAEFINNSTQNPKDSFLKVPASSYRSNNDGSIYTSNIDSYLWTNSSQSTIGSYDGIALKYDNKISYKKENTTVGIPVRCIKDYDDSTAPIISSIKVGSKVLNDGDNNISVTDDITIEFSEEIRAEDISSSSIILKREGGLANTPKYANKIVTFSKANKDALLEKGYRYTLTVKTTIKDISGNAIETQKVLSFETVTAPDTILPKIDYVNSSLGKYSSNSKNKNVSVSDDIKIVFSESINSDTITKLNILLDNGAKYSVSLQNNKELIVSFDSKLSYETTYKLVLKEDIKDLAGNNLDGLDYDRADDKTFTFVTQSEPDSISPQMESSSPSLGSADVSISSNISITFDEEVKDYNSSNVILKKDLNDAVIATTLTYSNKVLTINPKDNLENETAYKLLLKTSIKDLFNNPLKNEIEITFTTSATEVASCSGIEIDGICYEISSVKKAWEDAKNSCENQSKRLVSKDDISNWVEFASSSKLNLDQNENYWLAQGEAGKYKRATYLRYSQWSSAKWSTTTSYNDEKYLYICKSDNTAPTASLTKPSDSSNVAKNMILEVSFSEEVKNVNSTNIILKNSSDSMVESTITYSNKILRIEPKNNLDANTNYTITLKEGIVDLFANKLKEKIISFRTNDQVVALCAGIKLDSKCYVLETALLKWDEAKASCISKGMSLVSKDSGIDWTALASGLSLNQSKKYWLLEGSTTGYSGVYYLEYYSGFSGGYWKAGNEYYTSGYPPKSNTYEYFCVK